MELTAAASWLNTVFAGYDRLILSALHAVSNSFFTFLFKLITLIGEKGIVFFLAAILFMLFPKTRKLGVCIFGAVCCGALITNIILKDAVARPRPLTVEPYLSWWAEIGAPAEDGWSFPSGHVTAAAAGMVAIRLMKGKKWTVPAVVWILLMMIARNYLMAHYPSDVLFAALIGTASAFIAWYITRFIFQFLYINRKKGWCGLVLSWSAPDYRGIPSKLGLTGEPVNDYFAKAFEGSAPSENAGNGGAEKRKWISALSDKLSSLKSRLPSSQAPAGEAEGVLAESQASPLTGEEAVHAAEGQPIQPAEGTQAENAQPDQNSQTAKPSGSHLSASGSSTARTRSSSGYQGKHVR